MGSHGNPTRGLLKAMIEAARRLDPAQSVTSVELTESVMQAGFWNGKQPLTPERTVNMYCSQNSDVFHRVGPDTYKLERNWW